jgi:hypothetical protein
MAVHRWGDFSQAAVRMMGQVKPGEDLLIVADTWTDMEIAEACLIAGINAKANAQLLVIPRTSLVETREYNPSTAGAIQGAVTFGFGHQDPIYRGKAGPAQVHIDALLRHPSILTKYRYVRTTDSIRLSALRGNNLSEQPAVH